MLPDWGLPGVPRGGLGRRPLGGDWATVVTFLGDRRRAAVLQGHAVHPGALLARAIQVQQPNELQLHGGAGDGPVSQGRLRVPLAPRPRLPASPGRAGGEPREGLCPLSSPRSCCPRPATPAHGCCLPPRPAPGSLGTAAGSHTAAPGGHTAPHTRDVRARRNSRAAGWTAGTGDLEPRAQEVGQPPLWGQSRDQAVVRQDEVIQAHDAPRARLPGQEDLRAEAALSSLGLLPRALSP